MPSYFPYRIDFDQPAYLWLLALLPVAWYWGRQGFVVMGSWRRWCAFGLRAAVIAALALALAEVHVVRTSDRLAVIYALDHSLSISPDQTKAAIEFVNKSRAHGRDKARGDVAGVIVFGRHPAVELPPLDDDVPLVRVESQVDGGSTDLAAALRLARACFPADCAKRLVLISDGNENLGTALDEARASAAAEIGIDVVVLRRPATGDVAIEKLAVPSEVRRGTPFDVRVVLNNERPAEQATSGRLRVFRRLGAQEQLVADEAVAVEPGKRVFSFREELASSDFYTYDSEFIPDQAAQDVVPENNRATAFTQVHGSGRVLLIEDWSQAGGFAHLVERLRTANIEVDVMPSNRLFDNLAELQRYDTVVLADVPRTSGDDAENVSQFTDEQIDLLVRNTEQMGSGLVMLGGPNSFGAGGWANTALERAMPVDFQIKNAKVVPQGALALVLDKSGSMSGEKIEITKAAAIAALKVLGERDQVGVVAFDGAAQWVANMQPVGTGNRIAARLSRLSADGGTNMQPGMSEGYRALARAVAGAKHMIVLTDGRTNGAGFESLAARNRAQGITTTCVAIGTDADIGLMQSVARAGGGKFYKVDNPKAVPRIFMREARRVARPLVYENEQGIPPQVAMRHEMLEGIAGPLPPMSGYVMTTAKSNPLVEVALTSPLPAPGRHPLLASWTFGLGRAVALTTDAGQRWTKSWTEWSDYDRLFTQLVRWSMRPTTGDGRATLFAEARDGVLQAIVTAQDKDDEFLNLLTVRGAVIDPKMKTLDLEFSQFAPGRYVAECPMQESGTYFVTAVAGAGLAPLRTGLNVPTSAELRQLEPNLALLEGLAGQAPRNAAAGQIFDAQRTKVGTPLELQVFRRDLPLAVARQPVWQLALLAAAALFLLDVFQRRVVISFAALAPVARRLAGGLMRAADERSPAEALGRLRGRKEEIDRQIAARRVAARYEIDPEAPTAEEPRAEELAPQGAAPHAPHTLTPEVEADSYTARLLKVKERTRRGSSPSQSSDVPPAGT